MLLAEPGTDAQIKNFCSVAYHVTFPIFSKVDVNGPNAHPVYQFLRRELPESEGGGGGKGAGRELIWNFQVGCAPLPDLSLTFNATPEAGHVNHYAKTKFRSSTCMMAWI